MLGVLVIPTGCLVSCVSVSVPVFVSVPVLCLFCVSACLSVSFSLSFSLSCIYFSRPSLFSSPLFSSHLVLIP